MEIILNNTNDDKPTLCLNMIVKNESKIITRLFDSVLPIIDCYCICDTGSTDDTIKIIQEYFTNKNIPGKVVSEPFKNFCYNRTFALTQCVNMSDYVLLLDADMVLEINDFDKNLLKTADSFTLLQGNDSFFYYNLRIVKNNGLYSYIGVTHEYINTPSNNISSELTKNQLFIRDHGDGGSKHDKFERDIKLLIDGIKEEPNNDRYHFYLANSYHDTGKYEEAIKMYQKRIELNGWDQEIWYSYYRIGNCYKNMGKISEAICAWMNAYNYLPERLEGLYEIIKHYRIISKHKLAELFYEIAKKILNKNLKREKYLFLHNDVYTSKLYYEYTIIACYLNIKNINDEVILVLNNSNDSNESNNLLSNMKFYKDVLKPIHSITIDNSVTNKINNEDVTLTSSSSCIIQNSDKTKDGYMLNIRYVNYIINEHGGYLNCDKHIITANKVIHLDNKFNVLNEKWFDLEFNNRKYIGIEDVRIFNDIDSNNILFIGTGYHKNNTIGIVQGIYNINENSLIEHEIKSSFSNSHCEKNWVFVDYKDSTHIIYNWHPLQICKINQEDKLLNLIEKKNMPKIFSYVRGSTNGFKYLNKSTNQNELWFVTHIVSYEQPRHYYHMIIVFDELLNLKSYSAPFKFEGESIEYCLGLVVEDDRVLITHSTWDRTTRLGIYDKKYIDSIIKYN